MTRLLFKAYIIFMFGMLLGMALAGCAKEPDPVALNTPITAQQQAAFDQVRAEQNVIGYNTPKAGWDDSASYRYHSAKTMTQDATVSVGKAIGMIFFHALMLILPLIIIIIVPGFAAGSYEMTIEGVLMVIIGIVMAGANWVGALDLAPWVMFSMILPGAVLFFVSFFAKEGLWKILLVMGPPVLMVLLGFLKVVDTYMTALVGGSIFALAGGVLALYLIFHGGEEEEEAHA